ncbi:hypothetical protein ACR3S4_10375 [Streptomyces sp. CH8.1]|nr:MULTISPECIES: hypothetical protein [unclassified Streptomyces]
MSPREAPAATRWDRDNNLAAQLRTGGALRTMATRRNLTIGAPPGST